MRGSALALGATAVSVGRELMNSLSEKGANGVKKRIEEMTEELTEELTCVMSRTCSKDINHIDSSIIKKL